MFCIHKNWENSIFPWTYFQLYSCVMLPRPFGHVFCVFQPQNIIENMDFKHYSGHFAITAKEIHHQTRYEGQISCPCDTQAHSKSPLSLTCRAVLHQCKNCPNYHKRQWQRLMCTLLWRSGRWKTPNYLLCLHFIPCQMKTLPKEAGGGFFLNVWKSSEGVENAKKS